MVQRQNRGCYSTESNVHNIHTIPSPSFSLSLLLSSILYLSHVSSVYCLSQLGSWKRPIRKTPYLSWRLGRNVYKRNFPSCCVLAQFHALFLALFLSLLHPLFLGPLVSTLLLAVFVRTTASIFLSACDSSPPSPSSGWTLHWAQVRSRDAKPPRVVDTRHQFCSLWFLQQGYLEIPAFPCFSFILHLSHFLLYFQMCLVLSNKFYFTGCHNHTWFVIPSADPFVLDHRIDLAARSYFSRSVKLFWKLSMMQYLYSRITRMSSDVARRPHCPFNVWIFRHWGASQ